MFAARTISTSAASTGALALLALLSACSDGAAERADGPPDYTGNPSNPYVPSTPNPNTANPDDPTTGTQDPSAPPVTQPSGNGGNPSTEGQDPDVSLDPTGVSGLGAATMGGSGSSSERYHKTDVTRDGQNYFLMANGWGPGFQSQSISWNGTAFTVNQLQGSQGPNYEPASYPTVFCGVYSDSRSRECGLPAPLDSITSLRTGWSWRANGNTGQYNAAYDIWVGTSSDIGSHSGFLMVWYREPPGQQPAGSSRTQNVTVQNVEGTWDIWTGQVLGKPIINWVRDEGQDTPSMEFDILDFVRDAESRGLTVPGNHVLSVAVGFEIWNGPITNLESVDFYVDVE
jgi:hypothetical protein